MFSKMYNNWKLRKRANWTARFFDGELPTKYTDGAPVGDYAEMRVYMRQSYKRWQRDWWRRLLR